MATFTNLGPGDAATWGACTGHPMDPRTDDDDGRSEDADAGRGFDPITVCTLNGEVSLSQGMDIVVLSPDAIERLITALRGMV